MGGVRLHPQVLNRLKRFVLVTSTGASTRIEGARLSDEDIEKLMRGISIQRFSDRDKQEVKGYFELLRNVFDSWQTIKFSENTIKHLHKELLKYVAKDKLHLGEYKKKENKVLMINEAGQSIGVLFDTTPPYLTSKEMHELVEATGKAFDGQRYHPLLVIANFLVEFLHIHPFEDGNGRISRVLTNLLLLQNGYVFVPYVSHEKLIEDNKPDYYMALRKSQKTMKTKKADILPWLDFFLTMMLQQSQMAIDLLSKENIEKILSAKQTAVWEFLQTVPEASPREISEKTKVVLPTVAQALNKLIQLRKVERIGLGRSTRYKKI
ncbi:MAG: Fic family protein [Candidatus Omnitrophica bacterium]|nr:Fic family protein [Candidatus Omnitrophota bacterium]